MVWSEVVIVKIKGVHRFENPFESRIYWSCRWRRWEESAVGPWFLDWAIYQDGEDLGQDKFQNKTSVEFVRRLRCL